MSNGIHIDHDRLCHGRALSLEQRPIVRTAFGERVMYKVPSEQEPDVEYDVFEDTNRWVCQRCPDFEKRQQPCKHIFEVLFRFYEPIAPKITQDELERYLIKSKKGTMYKGARHFPRPAYVYKTGRSESRRKDIAFEIQNKRMLEYAKEIRVVLNERFPDPKVVGRPLIPIGDLAALIIVKTQRGYSQRAAVGLADELYESGVLSTVRKRSAMSPLYNSERMSDALMHAYSLVKSLFVNLETTFIVDSTGFSPFFVSNNIDAKFHNRDYRVGTKWFKVHVLIGRESKAILGLTVTKNYGENSHDIRQFSPLIERLAADRFDNREFVIADNAYLVPDCFKAAKALRLTLVGPLRPRNYFKGTNVTRPQVADMVAFGEKYPDIYDEYCRSRNIIEGIFGGMKREDNHIASTGPVIERPNKEIDGLFLSRVIELRARGLVQALRKTNEMEQLRHQISFLSGTTFRKERE